MAFDPARYIVSSVLIRAEASLRLEEVVQRAELPRAKVLNALWDLTAEGAAVEGELLRGRPGPQYAWAAGLKKRPGKAISLEQAQRRARTDPSVWPQDLSIDSPLMNAFHAFVMDRYEPPGGKRWLVLLQCSVHRPFSKSPSHAFFRRAIATATGFDPAWQYRECPAHVVVMASRIGPVPYELENVYPANVSGGGVKHFSDDLYAAVEPVLARRMAEYLQRHAGRYEHVAAFGDRRYAEVMGDAAKRAGVAVAVYPDRAGPSVVRWGRGSTPRTYWQRYWIQLCLDLMGRMGEADRAAAEQRLADGRVEWR